MSEYIESLIPTHNTVRSIESVKHWIRFFEDGKMLRFQKVLITDTTRQNIYLHDGLHRVVAMCICGIEKLETFEYIDTEIDPDTYNEINLEVGYVTPFNPITEVRLPDFMDYKTNALNMRYNKDMILQCSNMYKEPRTVNTIKEIADNIKDKL